MLARDFAEMPKINIDMPHHLHSELFAFLFVINGRSANYAVELLHEEAPITTLEHCEARVIKALCQHFWRLLSKLNHIICLSFGEIFGIIEVVVLWIILIYLIFRAR